MKWWAEYPAELLEKRVVRPLQQYLTDELFVTKKLTVSVMNVIKVLAKVEEANQIGRKLPPEAFYNELIRWAALRLQVPLPVPASLSGNNSGQSVAAGMWSQSCLAGQAARVSSRCSLACGVWAALQLDWPA